MYIHKYICMRIYIYMCKRYVYIYINTCTRPDILFLLSLSFPVGTTIVSPQSLDSGYRRMNHVAHIICRVARTYE